MDSGYVIMPLNLPYVGKFNDVVVVAIGPLSVISPWSYLNKKLSCQSETAQRFLSLNILLNRLTSLETTLLSKVCVSPYQYSIETMSVYRTVSEIFSVKNGVTVQPGVGVIQGH